MGLESDDGGGDGVGHGGNEENMGSQMPSEDTQL